MEFLQLDPPASGSRITREEGRLVVPYDPIIPFIEGDGCGSELWAAARPVLDAAVEEAFGGQRKLHWYEIFAGHRAQERFEEALPSESVQAIRYFHVGMKGPLETPVGGGTRSLTLSLRREGEAV